MSPYDSRRHRAAAARDSESSDAADAPTSSETDASAAETSSAEVSSRDPSGFVSLESAGVRADVMRISRFVDQERPSPELDATLARTLAGVGAGDVDAVVRRLRQFLEASGDPRRLLARLEADPESFTQLMRIFATGDFISRRLIADPDGLGASRFEARRPVAHTSLVERVWDQLRRAESPQAAGRAMEAFVAEETARVGVHQCVYDLPPSEVGRRLSRIARAAVDAALRFSLGRLRLTAPSRPDGTKPVFAVLGFGAFAREELNYDQPLGVIVVCDRMDRERGQEVGYVNAVAASLGGLFAGDAARQRRSRNFGLAGPPEWESLFGGVDQPPVRADADARPGEARRAPRTQRGEGAQCGEGAWNGRIAAPVPIIACDVFERRVDQSTGLADRIALAQARPVAGDRQLGARLFRRLRSVPGRRYFTCHDLCELEAYGSRLGQGSAVPDCSEAGFMASPPSPGVCPPAIDVVAAPGGRRDVASLVGLLGFLFAERSLEWSPDDGPDDDPSAATTTPEVIFAMHRAGIFSDAEAAGLAENDARLCRLQHQITLDSGRHGGRLTGDVAHRGRIAWRLGICDSDGLRGDATRFTEMLDDTLAANRRMIAAVVADLPRRSRTFRQGMTLDPAGMDSATLERVARAGRESVPQFGSRRAGHAFARLMPDLWADLRRYPSPTVTLARINSVAEAVGGKATFWGALAAEPETRRKWVRVCALSPRITALLVADPGLIEAFGDSLIDDNGVSPEVIDERSVEYVGGVTGEGTCGGMEQEMVDRLLAFRRWAELRAGVRAVTGQSAGVAQPTSRSKATGTEASTAGMAPDPRRAMTAREITAAAAESVIRRVVEFNSEQLSRRHGDPVDRNGDPVEMIVVACGRLGGRGVDFDTPLELRLLYSGSDLRWSSDRAAGLFGPTRRRVGGPRSTLSCESFLDRLAAAVIRTLTAVGVHESAEPILVTRDSRVVTASASDFFGPYAEGTATASQWRELTRMRAVTGRRETRRRFDAEVVRLLQMRTARGDSPVPLSGLDHRPTADAEPRLRNHFAEADDAPEAIGARAETDAFAAIRDGRGGTAEIESAVAATLACALAGAPPASLAALPTATLDVIDFLRSGGEMVPSVATRLADGYRALVAVESALFWATDRSPVDGSFRTSVDGELERRIACLLAPIEIAGSGSLRPPRVPGAVDLARRDRGEGEVTDSRVTDSRVTDSRVTDSRVTDSLAARCTNLRRTNRRLLQRLQGQPSHDES